MTFDNKRLYHCSREETLGDRLKINENVSQSTMVAETITRDIAGVNGASNEIAGRSDQVKGSAERLQGLANELNAIVNTFKI